MGTCWIAKSMGLTLAGVGHPATGKLVLGEWDRTRAFVQRCAGGYATGEVGCECAGPESTTVKASSKRWLKRSARNWLICWRQDSWRN